VKYDGYRLSLEREGNRVRLIIRGGYNWADRYPWIVEAALKNRHKQFVIDGRGRDPGRRRHRRFQRPALAPAGRRGAALAFDILSLDGDDLRQLPLSMRKPNLARLLARHPDGIFLAPYEQGEIGPDLFRAACDTGLEGLVRSAPIDPIAPADRRTGSRSRTGSIRLIGGYRFSSRVNRTRLRGGEIDAH
jgi:ATP-dependent DNA ligase